MTAPDPTPCLRPGVDLITAADVLAWLEEMRALMVGALPDVPLSAPAAVEVTVELLTRHLHARLDRERRQACRRGARKAWKDARAIMRKAKDTRGRRRDRALTEAIWAPPLSPWASRSDDDRCAIKLLDFLALALAFRAAARATP